jgi:hypothetical protein
MADGYDAEKIQLTVMQRNEIIEEKLAHLQPEMEKVLAEMENVLEGFANGEIHWKDLLERAFKKHQALAVSS